MRRLVFLLALTVTSAIADDARVTLPVNAVRELVRQNEALREDNKRLDAESDEWRLKYQHQIGLVGVCT